MAIVTSLFAGGSLAHAFDDWEFQQQQFEMQLRLQEQQMRQQLQELRQQMKLMQQQLEQQRQDFKMQQQQFKQELIDRQQDFKLQQETMKLGNFRMQQFGLPQSFNSNLYIDTNLSRLITAPTIDPIIASPRFSMPLNRDFNSPLNKPLGIAFSPTRNRYSDNLMDWQHYSIASQGMINDLTRDANLRIPDTIASYGFDFIMKDVAMPGFVQTSSDMAVVLHTARMQTVHDWYRSSLADTYAGRISRITVPVLTIALTAGSAMETFINTAQYIGRSMQIFNPLMPETRISFPDMSLKPGYNIVEGLQNLKTWAKDLATNRIRPVQFETTRIIPLDSQIDIGNTRLISSGFFRDTLITFTPTTTAMERAMLKLYPVNSYFDPMTSTTSWQRESVQTIREITMPSYQSVPMMNLNNFSANWNNFGTNWSTIQTNLSFPRNSFDFPKPKIDKIYSPTFSNQYK